MLRMSIPRRINTPFTDIPDFFRQDVYKDIFDSVEKSGNIQLVGLWGFGKSLTLRVLESNQENIKKNLKVDDNTLVFLSDLSLLADNSTSLVLKHIFAKMLGLEKLQSTEGLDLTQGIQKYFDKVRKDGKKIILILDSLEKLESNNNLDVFNFLHALYKQNIDFLSFVFCFEHKVSWERARDKFGDLGRLMFSRILYLTPLNNKEENWFFDAQAGMIPETDISFATKKLILVSSGGYMVTIKRLIEAETSGEDVKTIIENPDRLAGLAYSLDILLDGLGAEIETLKKVVNGDTNENDLNQIDILRKHYLIDEKNIFLSRVLENYLRKKFGNKSNLYEEKVGDLDINARLTASEYKILDFLNKNKGKISSREDIINTTWGEKAEVGISDHALDQIISRLRKKLANSNSKIGIETLRGRGHRLV